MGECLALLGACCFSLSLSLSLSAAAYPELSDQFLVTARHASNAEATRTRPVAGKRSRMEAS